MCGSAFKNAGFFQRTRFNSQHPQGNAQLSISGLPLLASEGTAGMECSIHRQVEHPHEKLIFKIVTEIELEIECKLKG